MDFAIALKISETIGFGECHVRETRVAGSYHDDSRIFLFYFNVSDKAGRQEDRLELDHLSLALLLSAQLEVLRSLDRALKHEKMSNTGTDQ